MARIPEEEIERLKRETDLAELVRRRGVRLERHGRDLIGLCPLHDDRSPSLVITPAKNLWHCLGACQTGGSVIDWVMKSEGVSVRHALELLREGRLSVGPIEPVKLSTVAKLPSPVSADASDAEALRQAVAYYHETLQRSPQALAYLESRGIANPEAIERFQIGYADRSLGLRIPEKNRRDGAAIRTRLQALGVLRESGHEHFNGCVVFPVIHQGEVLGIYGRKIRDDRNPGCATHLYLSGPHRGIWNLEAFAESKELILCESIIDALTFWCAGFRNVSCAYGVKGFTPEMLEAMKAYGIGRVLLAYDADDAGDSAAKTLAARLIAEGIGAARIHFPRGMDANEYAQKVTPAAQALGIAINSAEWLGGPPRVGDELRGLDPGARETAPRGFSLAAEQPLKEEQPDEALPMQRQPQVPTPEPPSPNPADPIDVILGDRQYKVRGLEKNLSYEQMRVVLRVACGTADFIDSVDLVSARQRLNYVKQAAVELGVKEEILRADLAKVRGKLEPLQEALIRKTLEPKIKPNVSLSPDDEKEALEFLRDPMLIHRIVDDFDRCGFVGETTNKLMAYLAAVSRKLAEPLAIIIQSSSAAGKTALMDAVLAFVPEEERVRYSAMTGRALFYMQGADLKHKILAISEEEGAEQASYALKLLQSEGKLTIASTGKDPATGKLVTEEYHVEGPVMIIVTTTKVEIDEELLNRCIVLTVDEDRAQTRAIHELQRAAQTLEGLLARRESDAILRVHRNAQRLLRPLLVANPYARHLTFLDGRTRTRRDHMKYLTLIRTIALLHQYQRPVKTAPHRGESVEYIDVTKDDIRLANTLAHEVLGRSLDELPPQTRRLVVLLDQLVTAESERLAIDRSEVRFTQRQVRELTGWSVFQVKIHLRKLTEMEYLLLHHGGRGQSFVYELVYRGEGDGGKPFLLGLADAESLPDDPATLHAYEANLHAYDSNRERRNGEWEHQNSEWEPPGSPQGAPREHGGSTGQNERIANADGPIPALPPENPEKGLLGGNGKDVSYTYPHVVPVGKPRRPRS